MQQSLNASDQGAEKEIIFVDDMALDEGR